MLYFDKIDVSEGVDVNKASELKECNICHCWYFLNYSFNFQANLYERCHGLLLISMNLSDIAVLNVKVSDYDCIISLIGKNEVKNSQNADFIKTVECYKA